MAQARRLMNVRGPVLRAPLRPVPSPRVGSRSGMSTRWSGSVQVPRATPPCPALLSLLVPPALL
eukprot:10192061-Lingulodinium_polyedra.AAC.1